MAANIQSGAGTRSAESGNVLFLILIAVALFAALSYAVTQSTRSGSGDASSETNLINSAQLAQYPAGVRTAVVRMVIGGTSVDNLLFDIPANFDAASTAGFPLVTNIFHPTGGGAVYQTAPQDLMEPAAPGSWIYSSKFQVDGIGITNAADDNANELVAFLPGISREVCRKLNQELGIVASNTPADGVPDVLGGTPPGAAPAAADEMAAIGAGAPGVGANAGIIGGDMAGQPFGCFRIGAANATYPTRTYIYYHVLVER